MSDNVNTFYKDAVMMRLMFILISLCTVMVCGCSSSKVASGPAEPQNLGSTVGTVCELSGFQGIPVHGRSLVYGLPGTGSAECPPTIKNYLTQTLRRYKPERYMGLEYSGMTPDEIINSRSTAVVQVSGTIYPGVPSGALFDIKAFIPWATQTTSLQGGKLLFTEMRQIAGSVAGRMVAVGAGPLFIDTFEKDGQDGGGPNMREGYILAGGKSAYDRRIRLALMQPDSRIAQQVQNRINSRFQVANGRRVADASNREWININIPEAYSNNSEHFIKVMMSLYLRDSAKFQDLKLQEINELVFSPDADLEAIALAWEAIGRPALKYISPLYKNSKGPLQFYAARTALALEDFRAIDILAEIALDDKHPHQVDAIKVLDHSGSDPSAAIALSQLLDHTDPRIRFQAYQSLKESKSVLIRSLTFPDAEFILDEVKSSGENLIIAWAGKKPRIVLFGDDLACHENIFFESKDKIITLNASDDSDRLSIARVSPDMRNHVRFQSKFSVKDMIKTLAWPLRANHKNVGAGLTFSQLVDCLGQMCDKDVIPARFKMYSSILFIAERPDAAPLPVTE